MLPSTTPELFGSFLFSRFQLFLPTFAEKKLSITRWSVILWVTACAGSRESLIVIVDRVWAAISLLSYPPVFPETTHTFNLSKNVSLCVCWYTLSVNTAVAMESRVWVFVTCSILLSLLKRSPSCTPASKGRRVRNYCPVCPHPVPSALSPTLLACGCGTRSRLRGVLPPLLHAVCCCSR